MLTSHTRNWDGEQVATVSGYDPDTGMITLASPIDKPITLADSSDFAIEVASLTRRVVFEADSDATHDALGGHFVVHHMSAHQHIEGVEIRNFGQQGILGKYPLHFHMCGDNPSTVKKNVVRDSNQRCYVIHMTNNVTLEDNVAYDTFGHCYFLEAGTEIGNTFTRNLGAKVKKMPAEKVALLEAASNRDETDDSGSVFWISNAHNSFYGNVAAGGEAHGYWFETHGDQQSSNLQAFEDNEVHSSKHFAFTVYSPGWRPTETNIIKNIKVYRNPTWGAFRKSKRLLSCLSIAVPSLSHTDLFTIDSANLNQNFQST